MKSTFKTISWLVVSGIASTGWYESGSFKVGLFAAFWACLLKTPIYWLHEVLWERRKGKKTAEQPVPVAVVDPPALWLRNGELQAV